MTIGLGKRAKNYRLIDDILYRVNSNPQGTANLLVIPRYLVREIIFSHHSEPTSGHLGIAKTLNKISTRYYWLHPQKDVEKFKGCVDCQARKGQETRKPVGFLQPIPIGMPFERVDIDILGPFRKSSNGKTVIVVATDYATRWAETAALTKAKAGHVAKFLMQFII